MNRSRDKLGEYVMYAETRNRYEPFATVSTNYATIDKANPNTNAQGSFDLYYEKNDPGQDERRGLIHSDCVLGSTRQVERVIFDIPHYASSYKWSVSGSAEEGVGWEHYGFGGRLRIKIRPVLTDFDPATVTWNIAYWTDGGLSYGTEAAIDHVVEPATGSYLHVNCAPGDPTPPPAHAEAVVEIDVEAPGLLTTKLSDIATALADWNAESAIYGWEIAVETDTDGDSIHWEGALDATSQCFAILA